MSERRWIHEEGCPPDVREALERAGQARMDVEMRARLAHRLGPMLGPEGGGGPTSVSSAGARGSWWLWAAAGIGVIGATIVAYTMTNQGGSESPRTIAESLSTQQETPENELVILELDSDGDSSIDTEPARASAKLRRRSHRTREIREAVVERTPTEPDRADAPESPPAETSAPSELELLTLARRLVRSDPRSAIAVLTRHATLFPRGIFAEEREVLAVEAYARSGDLQAARNRAQAFIRMHPNTAHRTRLVHFVGSLSETP